LPKALTDGVLAKDFDGDQIYDVLSQVLFNTWQEVPGALTWATYDPTTQWQNAENSGLGDIDRPGNYELAARTSSRTDVYSLVAALATSGLGYIFESSTGQIGYADSTHRTNYLAANGYVDLTANHALAPGLSIQKRAGDIRNSITEFKTEMFKQSVALDYLVRNITYLGAPKDIRLNNDDKINYLKKILEEEFLPHCGPDFKKKAYFLGYMVNRMILDELNGNKIDLIDYINETNEKRLALTAKLGDKYGDRQVDLETGELK
jgi:hypothetical protein